MEVEAIRVDDEHEVEIQAAAAECEQQQRGHQRQPLFGDMHESMEVVATRVDDEHEVEHMQQQQQQASFISFTLEDTIIMVPSALAAEWRSEDAAEWHSEDGDGGGSGSSEPHPPPAMLEALTYWLQGTSWKAPKLMLLKPASEKAAQEALIAVAPLLEAKVPSELHATLNGGKMVQFCEPQHPSVFMRFASALGVIPLSQEEGCPSIVRQLGIETFDNWWVVGAHQRRDASVPLTLQLCSSTTIHHVREPVRAELMQFQGQGVSDWLRSIVQTNSGKIDTSVLPSGTPVRMHGITRSLDIDFGPGRGRGRGRAGRAGRASSLSSLLGAMPPPSPRLPSERLPVLLGGMAPPSPQVHLLG